MLLTKLILISCLFSFHVGVFLSFVLVYLLNFEQHAKQYGHKLAVQAR